MELFTGTLSACYHADESTNEQEYMTKDEILAQINEWKSALMEQLSELIKEDEWIENETASKDIEIEDENIHSLLYANAYLLQKKQLPSKLKSVWEEDKVWLAAFKDKKASHFIKGVSIWLPFDFDFVFQYIDVEGNEQLFASTNVLLKQITSLTLQLEKQLDSELKTKALETLKQFESYAEYALTNKLILLLDE